MSHRICFKRPAMFKVAPAVDQLSDLTRENYLVLLSVMLLHLIRCIQEPTWPFQQLFSVTPSTNTSKLNVNSFTVLLKYSFLLFFMFTMYLTALMYRF